MGRAQIDPSNERRVALDAESEVVLRWVCEVSLHPSGSCRFFVLVVTEAAQMIPIAVDHREVRLRVGTCEHSEHDTLEGGIELRYSMEGLSQEVWRLTTGVRLGLYSP